MIEAYEDVAPEAEGPRPLADPDEFFAYVTEAANLVDVLSDAQAAEIAGRVVADFDADWQSMSEWRTRMEKGLELARLGKNDKSYPWPKASNVKYPLVASAALQFNARAYPAIVPADRPVKVAVHGDDPDGTKADRADRMSAHMSWQVLNEMEEWEEATDRLLMILPVVGTVIRKTWWDAALDRPRVKTIEPGDFVVSDNITSLSEAPRMTEIMRLHEHEIRERERAGTFAECDYPDQDHDEALEFLEQHARFDLDEDGYAEPYIATVCRETNELVRLVADYEARDVVIDAETGLVATIRRGQYFTAFHFLPPMDGGFFGTGLGLLLGDISETVNTMLNIITDSAHLQSLGGGFLGREFRTRGGDVRFRPGEYKTMNAAGNDIRSAVVQLDMPGPSPVLFQVLGLLIDAGREIASVKDVMTGDSGGRAQTATTTLALIEQGMMVFSAAYRRVFRALKREFGQLARLNATHLSPERLARFHDGEQPVDPAQEYDLRGLDVQPVSDPRASTKMQEMGQAQLVMEMAQGGMIDMGAASRRILEAANVPDRDELAPEPTPEQQQAQQLAQQEEMMARRIALATAEAELAMKTAEIGKVQAEIAKTQAEVEETRAGAIKDLADADATAAGVGLAGQIETLRRLRDELRGMDPRGAGGMASAPRDRADAVAAPPRNRPPAPMGDGGLVERIGPERGRAEGLAAMGGSPGPLDGGFGDGA